MIHLIVCVILVFTNVFGSPGDVDADGRIIGGFNVTDTRQEFIVRIISAEQRGLEPGDTGYLASGVAITCNRVLTVAQAIDGFDEWYLGSGVYINVDDFLYHDTTVAFVHPNYVPETLQNNVGIIYTSRLMTTFIGVSATPPNTPINVVTSGYGITTTGEVSQFVKSAVFLSVSTNECSLYYNSVVIRDENFCGISDDSSLANGDQGGPVTNSINTVLLGVISTFGTIQEDLAVFINIYQPEINGFIVEHISNSQC